MGTEIILIPSCIIVVTERQTPRGCQFTSAFSSESLSTIRPRKIYRRIRKERRTGRARALDYEYKVFRITAPQYATYES